MSNDTSTDLAVRTSTDLASIPDLEKILLGDAEPLEILDDPAEISREIIMQLLNAQSDEELESFGNAIGWRELLGVPIQIQGFRWRPSTLVEGMPVFFIVNGTRLDTGEPVILTTGAGSVLAQLTNMAKRGTLVGAIRAIVANEKPTASGFYPLHLETPAEAKQAAA